MELELFDYHLPGSQIAQEKSRPRDMSRLFYIDARKEPVKHRHLRFRDMPELVDEGDLLILNRTRVIPARIPARKETGGKSEILLLNEGSDHTWEALVQGKKMKPGRILLTEDERFSIILRGCLGEGKWNVGFMENGSIVPHSRVLEWIRDHGLMPTPPYIKRVLEDPDEYQTIYARDEGSVAAPTAGLHFSKRTLEHLERRGVRIEYLVLHVGLGTFAPVKSEIVEDHVMEKEEYMIPAGLRDAIAEATEEHEGKGTTRIWAVGTTVMRALESGFDTNGRCIADQGRTGLFITPGYDFHLPYKGFITNFHLPKSTPLMLVSAFHDRERVLEAYREAVDRDYRFYSLGDAMMIRRGE